MKVWPVPNSYSREIPKSGANGSFWEDRGDRYHCGIDIYAPEDSEVIAIEGGHVIDVGIFTSPEMHPYWNSTKYIIIKTSMNVLFKYAELKEVHVHIGEYVETGQQIGTIGTVIASQHVSERDPHFVRELAEKGNLTMLHLELYKAPVTSVQPYIAGSFFGTHKPESLIDPSVYLNGLTSQKNKVDPYKYRN